MKFFASKLICFLIQIVCFAIHLANFFLTDIMMYEITEGVSFDYPKLFKSPIFWIIIIFQLIDVLFCACLNILSNDTDSTLEKAYSTNCKKLLTQATAQAKKKDYYSAKKTLEIFDELETRRKGG